MRQFLRSSLSVLASLLLVLSVCCFTARLAADDTTGQKSLDPVVMLPDGTEFKTWETAAEFSKTYYVDGANAKASDQNPGTRDRPFATIHRAAQCLEPGERVVVAEGVYREQIRPARGGTGPAKMISYEAAPGAVVILKGSRVFRESWTADDPASAKPVWHAKLDPKYFHGYNPFDIENVTAEQFEIMDFARPIRGTPPSSLLRGLVFQEGRMLKQVANRSDLATSPGVYWIDRAHQELHVRLLADAKPSDVTLEISTQETVFAPEKMGLGFVRVKGFTVEQVAGPFPWQQVGAISTTRGHHWIIEENTVRQVNGVGIDLGVQLHRWPQPPLVGFHIVRRNLVTECGVCGICGLGPGGGKPLGLLIEDNELRGNAFFDVERLFETAAIKTHCNVGCVIRRNLICDTQHGAGIWMDWDNRNSRCTQNVIIDSHTMHGGIFVEASFAPNLIDNNFIFGTQGSGIYEHDGCRQIFAHNFIVKNSATGINLRGRVTDRRIDNRDSEYGMHKAIGNILVDNGKPTESHGEPSELSANLNDGVLASFDREKLELTWSVKKVDLPTVASTPGVTYDFWGKSLAASLSGPGPFGRGSLQPASISLANPRRAGAADKPRP